MLLCMQANTHAYIKHTGSIVNLIRYASSPTASAYVSSMDKCKSAIPNNDHEGKKPKKPMISASPEDRRVDQGGVRFYAFGSTNTTHGLTKREDVSSDLWVSRSFATVVPQHQQLMQRQTESNRTSRLHPHSLPVSQSPFRK